MLYVFSVLPTSQDFIKQLNIIIYNFLWNGPDKIARSAAINDIRFGGVNLIDLVTSIRSLRLAWLGRLFSRALYHVKLTLITCSRIMVELFCLGVIMILKNTKYIPHFMMNFSNGWPTLERIFLPSLLHLKVLSGTISLLK